MKDKQRIEVFIIKRLFKLLTCVMVFCFLTGCGTINERLLIKKDGSGSVRLSLLVEKEYESQISAYLDDYIPGKYEVKSVLKGFDIYKMFYIDNEFEHYTELGYDSSEFKIEELKNNYIYTVRIEDFNEAEEVLTNDEFKQFLINEEIDLEFSITIMGHPLTKPKIKSGNYDEVDKTFFPASITAVWNVEEMDDIELVASLPPMIAEWFVIIGLGAGIASLIIKYLLVKNYGTDMTVFKFIEEKIVGKDEDEDY